MSRWFFLTNHALALSLIAREQEITAKKIALELQITERSVRKIIADLYAEGYIEKAKKANRNVYSVNHELTLRHHTQQDVIIGDFLKTLGWEGKSTGNVVNGRKSGAGASAAGHRFKRV
jgi:DNA-binding transcriptional ArsR family regulator